MQLKIASVLCLLAISIGIKSQARAANAKTSAYRCCRNPCQLRRVESRHIRLTSDPLKLNDGKVVKDAKTLDHQAPARDC